ncbi:MFS transporter [Paraburkholderia caffeinilytica]|uniref:MFS transporter n=1 Tax=Paraburkholderia caffeinilytica TaxID=1761016 RepID=UPI0038BC8B0F
MLAKEGYEAQALLDRFDRIPYSRWHIKARVILGTATFFDAFDALTIAFVLPVLIESWQLHPGQIGLLISSVFIGQFFGALLFGWLAEKIGRIPSAILAIAIISTMSLVCAFATNYASLVTARVVQGIGLGGEMPVAAAYITEISGRKGRGRFFLLYELVFPLGLLLVGVVSAMVVPTIGWRAMFLLGAAPAVLIAFVIKSLPESPRWLISKGRLAQAESVISTVEASARRTDVTLDTNTVMHFPQYTSPRPASGNTASTISLFSLVSGLWSTSYRQRSVILWILWITAYVVNLSLVTWLPSLYKTILHLSTRDSLLAGLVPNVFQVVAILACALLVDRVGRSTWFLGAFLASAGLLLILSIFSHQLLASTYATILLASLTYAFTGTNCILLYLYTTEVYPTRLRAFGVGVATCWMRAGAAISPLLIGALLGRFGITAVFGLFAGLCIAGAAATFWAPETGNEKLEDLSA